MTQIFVKSSALFNFSVTRFPTRVHLTGDPWGDVVFGNDVVHPVLPVHLDESLTTRVEVLGDTVWTSDLDFGLVHTKTILHFI